MHETGDDVEWRATREDEPPLRHLKQTPASWRQIQKAQQRNHAEAPNVTEPGIHGFGLVPNVCFSNILRTVSKHTRRYQREERALRLLKLLLTPQGKALLEDFNPSCWRVCSKLVVEYFQDAIPPQRQFAGLSTQRARVVRYEAGAWQGVWQ